MWRFLLLLLAGCATQPEGICIEWDIRETTREKCIPLYGQMICSEQIVHTYQCVLRAEDGNTEKRQSES